jgi:hypothetical protein
MGALWEMAAGAVGPPRERLMRSEPPAPSWGRCGLIGALIGLRTGALAAALYLAAVVAYFLIRGAAERASEAPTVAGLVVVLGLGYVALASAIGAATGLLIGLAVRLTYQSLTGARAGLLGIALGAAIACAWIVASARQIDGIWIAYYALPLLIYVGLGGWVGQAIFRRVTARPLAAG